MMFWLLLLGVQTLWAQDYDYAYDGKIYLNPAVMANCMLRIADKYPDSRVQPPASSYLNSFSRWGEQCSTERQDNFDNWYLYFLGDSTRICDFSTGKEEKLKEWILNQEDNSIEPVMLFEKAMALNKGNIHNSLLTIHQLQRNNARWKNKKRYNYISTKEDAKKFWNKFVDIRGNLEELKGDNEGDHAGSWYRIWGLSLFRVKMDYPFRGHTEDLALCATQGESTLLGRGFKNLASSSAAIFAEAIKYGFDVMGTYKAGGDRGGKIKMNNLGADLGGYISSYTSRGTFDLTPQHREKTFAAACDNKTYITRQPAKKPKPSK